MQLENESYDCSTNYHDGNISGNFMSEPINSNHIVSDTLITIKWSFIPFPDDMCNIDLKFSGWNIGKDLKSRSVESFLRRIQRYMNANSIPSYEMLYKMSQFLYGPALNWYNISRHFIRSWDLFTHEILNRFSNPNDSNENIFNISKLFAETNNENPNNASRVSNRIQSSLLDSVVETLLNNSKDDVLNCIDETINRTSVVTSKLTFRRSCSYSPKFHEKIRTELNRLFKCRMIKIRFIVYPFHGILKVSDIYLQGVFNAFEFDIKHLIHRSGVQNPFINFKELLHVHGIVIRYIMFCYTHECPFGMCETIAYAFGSNAKSNRSRFMSRYGRSITTNGVNDSQSNVYECSTIDQRGEKIITI